MGIIIIYDGPTTRSGGALQRAQRGDHEAFERLSNNCGVQRRRVVLKVIQNRCLSWDRTAISDDLDRGLIESGGSLPNFGRPRLFSPGYSFL